MATKENKGGTLRNGQVEEDNRVKARPGSEGAYQGAQDTGDDIVRERGTPVQQRDGAPAETPDEEE